MGDNGNRVREGSGREWERGMDGIYVGSQGRRLGEGGTEAEWDGSEGRKKDGYIERGGDARVWDRDIYSERRRREKRRRKSGSERVKKRRETTEGQREKEGDYLLSYLYI